MKKNEVKTHMTVALLEKEYRISNRVWGRVYGSAANCVEKWAQQKYDQGVL